MRIPLSGTGCVPQQIFISVHQCAWLVPHLDLRVMTGQARRDHNRRVRIAFGIHEFRVVYLWEFVTRLALCRTQELSTTISERQHLRAINSLQFLHGCLTVRKVIALCSRTELGFIFIDVL